MGLSAQEETPPCLNVGVILPTFSFGQAELVKALYSEDADRKLGPPGWNPVHTHWASRGNKGAISTRARVKYLALRYIDWLEILLLASHHTSDLVSSHETLLFFLRSLKKQSLHSP